MANPRPRFLKFVNIRSPDSIPIPDTSLNYEVMFTSKYRKNLDINCSYMASGEIKQMNGDICLKRDHPKGLLAISYAILISLILSCDIFP